LAVSELYAIWLPAGLQTVKELAGADPPFGCIVLDDICNSRITFWRRPPSALLLAGMGGRYISSLHNRFAPMPIGINHAGEHRNRIFDLEMKLIVAM